MCSIAMPAELLLGHHNPPAYNPLLYSSLMVTTPTITNRSSNQKRAIRPCLSNTSLEIDGLLKNANRSDTTCCDNTKRKKKVVFADDRGIPLTQVRVMTEPSNMPPSWTSAYLSRVMGRNNGSNDLIRMLNNNNKQNINTWKARFAQPASDYLAFRKKLDENSVCLENIIIREAEQCLEGTVKVKNLAYDKEVVVRTSSDNWKTHEDVHCSFVEQPGSQSTNFLRNLYDTFHFRLTLPPKSNCIQFCVRYRTNDLEFWDNNDGKNYIVEKKQEPCSETDRWDLRKKCNEITVNDLFENNEKNHQRFIEDAMKANVRPWSEFASWQHLTTDAPYW